VDVTQEGNQTAVVLSGALILSEIEKIRLSKIFVLFKVDTFLG
jgi:hypothetical protein